MEQLGVLALPFLLVSIGVLTLWGVIGDRKRGEREDDSSADEDVPLRRL